MTRIMSVLVITLVVTSAGFGQVSFIDMAEPLNVTDLDFTCGVGIVDLDGDGYSEIIIASHLGADRLYRWQYGAYEEMGDEYGLSTDSDNHHNICLTDIDKDNLPDFFITGDPGYSNHGHLYLNYGHPPFDEVAESYNVADVREMGSAFFQYTPDSELAVLCGGNLMVRQGQTFVDITDGSGLEDIENVLTPMLCDFDGDNDDDLFVAGNHTSHQCRLYRNNGDTTFTDISGNTNEDGFPIGQGATVGDIDNDGDFDIYISSGFGSNTLWENDGTGYFTNITGQSNTGVYGYTRAAAFGDFDNDADLDLFVNRATDYNMLFLNDGTGVFTDCSQESNVMDNYNGAGCATSDLNNDGQLDIVAVNYVYDPAQVLINQNQNGSFLKIRLYGAYPNTMALGAIVKLYGLNSSDPPEEVLIGTRQIQSLSTMYSFSDPIIHFGTGDYENLRVIVTFNSLAVVELDDILPGQVIDIAESPTSISDLVLELPDDIMNINAYPNPFNNSINIEISGGSSGCYDLEIYDLLGRSVRTGKIRVAASSKASFTWDGNNDSGQPLPSGIYCIRVASGQTRTNTSITLLR
ncbi:MAG: T9SS type A sorting domain-containing protein [candidate division Zixibacteria bacterium]|nr:T9SS type A sorting domain-containing protein [candidate division Zixibacteria bacterium]